MPTESAVKSAAAMSANVAVAAGGVGDGGAASPLGHGSAPSTSVAQAANGVDADCAGSPVGDGSTGKEATGAADCTPSK